MGGNRFFYAFTERLVSRYNDLFSEDSGEAEDKYSSTGNFYSKWGGYISIAVLAGNDLTKFDTVTRLNIHECLTYLAYKKDVNAMELEQIKSRQQMNQG